jgi:hypothetical protein
MILKLSFFLSQKNSNRLGVGQKQNFKAHKVLERPSKNNTENTQK